MQAKKMTITDYLLAGFFAATIVVVGAGVVWRYALDSPLTWTVELSRILFVWMTFIGAALAIKEGSHICVTLLIDHLPRKVNKYLRIFAASLVILFLGFMVYVGVKWVQENTGARTPALDLPMNYVTYGALPVGFGLAIYFGLRRAVKAFRDEPEEPPGHEGT